MDPRPASERMQSKILVVDDTPANLRLLANLLMQRGYTVHPADSGEAALVFLQNSLPDLILLDIRLPGLDGFQVCQRIRDDPRTHDIPVIFISAANETLDKVTAFALGGVDYVVKPFQEQEVLARVATHLSLYHLQKHLEDRVAERTAELNRARDELVAKQILIQGIIDTSNALIYVKDLEGRYLLCNERFQSMFQLAGVVVGKTDHDLFPHETADAFRELDRQVFASGSGLEVEELVPHEDEIHTYLSIKSLLRDDAGRACAICSISTDITDRVREEMALRELNAQLEKRMRERMSGGYDGIRAEKSEDGVG